MKWKWDSEILNKLQTHTKIVGKPIPKFGLKHMPSECYNEMCVKYFETMINGFTRLQATSVVP